MLLCCCVVVLVCCCVGVLGVLVCCGVVVLVYSFLCDASVCRVSTQPKLTVLSRAYWVLMCWCMVGV